MKVLITVDTEVWPYAKDWRETALRADLRRDFYAETAAGDFGIPYQMRTLTAHGLKGVFFIEGLCALAAGIEPLREMVQVVSEGGHEVQIHLHSEWLQWIEPSPLPGRTGLYLREFTEDEQTTLLEAAICGLQEAGADRLTAFRAGNYGADFATLRALGRCGVRFDSSYNPYYLEDACGLRMPGILTTPSFLEGVWEVPISSFQDWPGHHRHVQLVAISAREMERALECAWRAGCPTFVIVSHGFELIHRHWQTGKPAQPNSIVIRRFERLCHVLARHSDRYRTVGFNDLTESDLQTPAPIPPLKGCPLLTVGRYGEQLLKRVLAR